MKRKQKGKKKFRHCFLMRLCITLPAAAGLAFLEARQYLQQYQSEILTSFLDRYDTEPAEKLSAADEKGELSLMMAKMTYTYATADAGEYALALYQPETGELITSEPLGAAFVWQNGERTVYQLHDQELVNRLDNASGLFGRANILVYSIYVRDDQFVPGEVFVQEKNILPLPRYRTEGKKIKGEWVDFSPENTDGWTKICCDYSKEYLSVYHDSYAESPSEELSQDGKMHFSAVMVLGSPNSPHASALLETMRERTPELRENAAETYQDRMQRAENGTLDEWDYQDLEIEDRDDKAEFAEKIEENYRQNLRLVPLKCFSIYYNDVDNADLTEKLKYEQGMDEITFRGETWELYHFQCVNPYDEFRNYYLVFLPFVIAGAFLLAVFSALIWSVISYLIYSKRYDIEVYRRNLTGTLAHDLKTLLAVIYGNAENIRAHTHPESADAYADCIMENVQHMDEMIAGVLGLAKLERGTAPEMKDTVDLTALLHTAFQRNDAQMQARSLTLTESGSLVIKGNAEMLTQLAENLAANAVQHAAEGGTITVTAEKNTLRISNPFTGTLDEKTLCEPFKRGDAARGSSAGSGLGLTIAAQIAALHKIRLRVTARDGIFTAALKKRPAPKKT